MARTLGGHRASAGVGTLLMLPAVFGTQAGGVPRRILAWRPMLALGLISYGVYLYHLTVAEWIAESADPAHFSASGLGLATHVGHVLTLALLAMTFAATVVMATLSYRYVELPFLRLKEPRRAGSSPSGQRPGVERIELCDLLGAERAGMPLAEACAREPDPSDEVQRFLLCHAPEDLPRASELAPSDRDPAAKDVDVLVWVEERCGAQRRRCTREVRTPACATR